MVIMYHINKSQYLPISDRKDSEQTQIKIA